MDPTEHDRRLPRLWPVAILCLAAAAPAQPIPAAPTPRPVHLKCEAWTEPVGLDLPRPQFSWEPPTLRDDGSIQSRGTRQASYELRVASSRESLERSQPDLWDSGRVASDATFGVPYAGKPLASAQQCWWQVRVWDQNDVATGWSDPASWTVGLLTEGDWKAKWIGAESRDGPSPRKGLGFHAKESRDLTEPKWVQVDLGRSLPIERIALWPVKNHGGADTFGFPVRFRVEASDDPDFKQPSIIADRTADDVPPPDGAMELVAPKSAGRYIRVTATKLWPRSDGVGCFALAELEVFSGGKNVAWETPVSAKDSVESWGWTAAALTDGAGDPVYVTPLLRKQFEAPKRVARALAFVSGLGQYEMTLNGAKVGDAWLTPGWTQYGKTALYDTYDITALLRQGSNAVGLRLGNGMYNMNDDTRGGQQLRSFGLPKAICQIRLEYADGTRDLIVSDRSWRVARGPTTYSGVFGGEDYDGRREEPGWDSPGFDDSRWKPALEVDGPGGGLYGLSHAAPPIKLIETREPVKVTALRPDLVIYDLGQNAPYIPRIAVSGPAGTVLRFRPAEILKPDGSIDQTTMRPGKLITYTLRGGENEAYWPRFFYCGSRYWQADARAPDGTPIPVESVVKHFDGLLVHSSSEPTGDFACSDGLFNQTYSLILWAMRSNMVSIITDCPHREKSGWLEQIHLNGPGLMYSFDMLPLFRKTVWDMADAQQANGMVPTMAPEYFIYENGYRDSVEWGGACIYLPRDISRWYGDSSFIAQQYGMMARYLAYLGTKAKDGILSNGLGDWDGYGNDKRTPIPVTDTAYYHLAAQTMSEFAKLLGKADDQKRYADLADSIRTAFNKSFLDPATGKVATGSQSCQATALDLGLLPDSQRQAAFDRLLDDVQAQSFAVSCGEVGHPSLLRVLADHNRSDLVYRIHHQSDRPGYGWQIKKGETTLTEAWDASPISHNHFMLGHIMEWFYADLAGLKPDPSAPAWQHIIINPQPVEGVMWARARYHSIRGEIAVEWKRTQLEFGLSVNVPPNCQATVHVPIGEDDTVTESGVNAKAAPGVHLVKVEGARAVYEIGSGDYHFSVAHH